jgi:1-deoxy-D-xylulose-5-phosphate synthase
MAIRYPRGGEGKYKLCDSSASSVLSEGRDVTLVAYGTMIENAVEAAEILRKEDVSAEIVKIGRIAPPDFAPVLASLEKTRRIVVPEEVCNHGCLGERLLAAAAGKFKFSSRLINLGDGITVQGSIHELQKNCGLDAEGIARVVRELMTREPEI